MILELFPRCIETRFWVMKLLMTKQFISLGFRAVIAASNDRHQVTLTKAMKNGRGIEMEMLLHHFQDEAQGLKVLLCVSLNAALLEI